MFILFELEILKSSILADKFYTRIVVRRFAL